MPRPNKIRSKVFRSFLYMSGPISFEDAVAGIDYHQNIDENYTDYSWRTDPGPVHEYKRLIKDHVSATTILEGSITQIVRSVTRGSWSGIYRGIANYAYVDKPYTVKFYGSPVYTRINDYTIPPPGSISTDTAEREASKKFYRKVKATQQSMSGLVFVGELRQTLKMLRNPAEALFFSTKVDYLQKLAGQKARDPRKWVRGIRGTFLEAFFGWLPLASDISGAAEALERLPFDPETARLITAVGKDTETVSRDVWSHFDGLRSSWKYKRHVYLQKKVKYRGLYLRERNGFKEVSKLSQTAQEFGFVLSEFVPTLWELLPWSFLVDYWSNIGDVLEMSFVNMESVRWCNRTEINDSVVFTTSNLDIEATRNMNTWAGHTFTGASIGDDSVLLVKRRSFQRVQAFPQVPRLALEVPGSKMKWLAMGALWSQANDIHPQRWKFKVR